MNKERIIESWGNSDYLPTPPDYLREIISYDFKAGDQKNIGEALNQFLESRMDLLVHSLKDTPFLAKADFRQPHDLLKDDNGAAIRNFAFFVWFQEGNWSKLEESFDFDRWKCEAFVSAFYAQQLGKILLLDNLNDLFLLALLNDTYLMMLSQTFPSLYGEFIKLKTEERLNPREQEKLLGAPPGELSSWILEKWGLTADFLKPLRVTNSDREANKISRIIYFSRLMTEFTLNRPVYPSYAALEKLFKSLFQMNVKQFQELIIEVLRVLPRQASTFGFSELFEITIFEVLKDHFNLLDKDLLSYQDLLSETLKAHRKISRQTNEIRQLKEQIERQYIRDTVTDLYNHMYLREFLIQKVREASRYEYPLTLIIFDLDGFRSFNNTFGYPAGNEILKQLSELIRHNIRQSDILARFGGDEFAIVMPYTGLPQSRLVAEKVKGLINEYQFIDAINKKSHKVTISMGFASILPGTRESHDEKLIALVQKALRKSQKSGGNTITEGLA